MGSLGNYLQVLYLVNSGKHYKLVEINKKCMEHFYYYIKNLRRRKIKIRTTILLVNMTIYMN